jgi:FtsP/CotA-like multicopper oxidase with cupredoxin domain
MLNLLRRPGALLTVAALGCAAGWPDAAKAGWDPCARVLQILHSTAADLSAGGHVYRQVPTLVPNRNGVLELDLVMKRSNIYIGRYWVEGAPSLSVTPRGGARAYILDAARRRIVRVPDECVSRPELIYGGTRWKLKQGDRIDAIVRSQLDFDGSTMEPPNAGGAPCNSSNLHVHGMLVSPRRGNADEGLSYGDYVFDLTMPGSSGGSHVDACASSSASASKAASGHKGHLITISPLHYQIDIPKGRVRAGDPVHDPLATGYHPSGVMWYHTHPHGYTRAQLSGGASGFISVGSVCDDLAYGGQGCQENNWNLHYIALKDVQLDNKGADARGGPRFKFARGYDMTLCEEAAKKAKASGGTLKGECDGPGPKPGKWLFTLNGVVYPTIRTLPGKIDVWMLANMSPNVSYNLQIVRASDGAPQKVKVLGVDGVSAEHYLTDALFMMPGSRAEIMLNLNPGEYVFRQTGFFTGQDEWPAVDLARVVIDEAAPLQRRFFHPWKRGFNQVRNLFPMHEPFAPPPVHAPPGARESCAKEGVRHVHFVWQPKDDNNPNSKEIFGLIAGVQGAGDSAPVYFDGDGRATRKSARQIYREYDRKDASGRLVHPNGLAFASQPYGGICAMKGREETWVVHNWTPEVHNLHMHQVRFRVAEGAQAASPHPRLSAAQFRGRRLRHGVMRHVDGVNHSLDFMERLLRRTPRTRGFADAYHDSIPIMMGTPAGSGKCDGSPENPGCRPATITLKVRMDRQESVGAMVYHCHILEHEDNGMMGVFRICDPSKRRGDPGADPECFTPN